jgi:hypothetical protein
MNRSTTSYAARSRPARVTTGHGNPSPEKRHWTFSEFATGPHPTSGWSSPLTLLPSVQYAFCHDQSATETRLAPDYYSAIRPSVDVTAGPSFGAQATQARRSDDTPFATGSSIFGKAIDFRAATFARTLARYPRRFHLSTPSLLRTVQGLNVTGPCAPTVVTPRPCRSPGLSRRVGRRGLMHIP